jgi:glutathione S-transferase
MKLLVFPHSHFCEKARWALDYKGVPFEPVPLLPGFHLRTVRRYAPNSSVPVLLHDNEAVQGADEIIQYLDLTYPARPLTPADTDERDACLEIEHTMDARLGENIRQILYHRLLAYPAFIRYCFTHPMPKMKQLFFRLYYPIVRDKIYGAYVFSDTAVAKARRDFDAAMGEMAEKIGGRKYLVSDRFTRVDLSIASMLSLLIQPGEHPFPWEEIPDRETRKFCGEYEDHPVSEWVRTMYREHRLHRGSTPDA